MFIQTEATADPDVMKFLPGRDVYAAGPARYASLAETERSPMARRREISSW